MAVLLADSSEPGDNPCTCIEEICDPWCTSNSCESRPVASIAISTGKFTGGRFTLWECMYRASCSTGNTIRFVIVLLMLICVLWSALFLVIIVARIVF